MLALLNSSDDVMLLDCGDEMFVCIGKDAPEIEKSKCMVTTQAFISKTADLHLTCLWSPQILPCSVASFNPLWRLIDRV